MLLPMGHTISLSSGVLYTVLVGLIFTIWTSPCYFHKHKEESNAEDYPYIILCVSSPLPYRLAYH